MTESFICEVGDWLCYKDSNNYEHLGIVVGFNSDKSEMTLQNTAYYLQIQSSVNEKQFLRLNRQNLNDTEFESLYDLENQLIRDGVLHFHRTKKMFDKYRDEFGTLFSLSREFENRSLVDLDMTFATLIENYVIETKTYIKKLTELSNQLNKD